MYLVLTVWMVKRQISKVVEVEEEEVCRVAMTDIRGKTEIRMLDKVLCEKTEFLL